MQIDEKLQLFQDLIHKSTREEISWIHGYCSAILAQNGVSTQISSVSAPAATSVKPTLIYGTESGNSKRVAMNLQAHLKKKQINARIFDAGQYPLQKFEKEECVLLIISTQGEGEPPASALKFFQHLHSESSSLENLRFAVLALGDSSYPLFCKAGEDIDLRLGQRNASRILDLRKCDTDFEEPANEWIQDVSSALTQSQGNRKPAVNGQAKAKTGNRLLNGRIVEHVNLNEPAGGKETYHIAIEVEEGLEYVPGDVAGIYPENPAEEVDKILEITSADPGQELTLRKNTATLREHLVRHLNLSYLSVETVKKYAGITGHDIPEVRMDLQDLLRIYPVRNPGEFEAVLKILNPVSPRLYSIASSPSAHEGELHLTVARSSFQTAENQTRFGVCSDFLARKKNGSPLQFFIRKNAHFRLPEPEKDIIMIGPGTGIAPFRSFVAERDATGATGRNWLFFGDRKFTENFLYQTEWQQYHASGVLTRINLAWSRDGKEKRYVQHEMEKEAEDLVRWIDGGASLYICGAKEPMSRDVENTLTAILSSRKKWTAQEAAQFLEDLAAQGRYQKDVY